MRVTFKAGVGLGGNTQAAPGETHEVPDALGYSLLADGRAVRAEDGDAPPVPTPPEQVETRDPRPRRKR